MVGYVHFDIAVLRHCRPLWVSEVLAKVAQQGSETDNVLGKSNRSDQGWFPFGKFVP